MANETTEITNSPVITMEGTPQVISESNQTPQVVTITLSQPAPVGGLPIDYIFTPENNAVIGEDLIEDFDVSENIVSLEPSSDGVNGVITIAEGATTATVVTFPLVDQDSDEEVLAVQLIQAEGYDIDSEKNSFSLKIVDDLPVIKYFGGPNIISESGQNITTASISLSQPAPVGGLAIDYIFTSEDTAVVGEDLTVDLDASQNLDSLTFTPDGTGGVVTITEGATEATVVVLPLVDDDTDAEVLNVKLTGAEGYDIDSEVNNFFVTIVDDLPTIKFSGTPQVISESQQTPQVSTIALSQPAPVGGLPINYIFGDKHTSVIGEDYTLDLDASENIASLEVAPDGKGGVVTVAEGATEATVVVLPLVDNDSDEEIVNVELTQAEGFDIDSEQNSYVVKIVDDLPTIKFSGTPQVISESQQTPQVSTITLSQPAPVGGLPINYIFGDKHTSVIGEDYTLDLDASENIASLEVAPDGKGGVVTVAEGATEATVVVLPLVDNDSDEEIVNVELTQAEGFDIDSEQNSYVVKIVDDLPEPKSNLVSGTSGDDLLIAGIDFDGIGNTIFTGAGDDEVDLFGGSKNRVDAGSGNDVIYLSSKDRVFGGAGDDEFDATDSMGKNRMSGGMGNDVFYLGKNDRAFGGAGDDKFFVQSGGQNIISGGSGSDQFWIVNGEISESTNTIVDFEAGSDVIGILGSSSLGIDASTLELNEVGNNTEIAFSGKTLAILNGVTGLDASSSVVFA